ncbi:DUF4126 domain-containing protein [Cupriavidus basilensis]|jgi:uncharacterized membrane protein|uniref:membrane protein n=1 Tax=Cupriavidus TaxID=106589 RepID=UPI00044E0EA5|nr:MULTISPECIES: membrane protein [Cupriavidus]KDP84263.1 membrane protein [Cupriavidus sp. SK-3]MDF3885739.1 DUF4126 domain-containing protein [Cupriavidus basilensis]
MTLYLLSLFIGIVAGLRAMTAPAAVSWAASLGLLDLSGNWLAFMGYRFTPWILSVLALAELVTDKLPATPSRKVPQQFGARIVTGALAGAAIGAGSGMLAGGAILGAIGAVIGTLGGAAIRARLAAAFGRDRPAALIEDLVAMTGAVLVVLSLA